MPFDDRYRRQVRLLLKILPHVTQEDCFALKGGTAINLFVRDMPRLSVDIDLTYLPISSREASLIAIDAAMRRIAQRIGKALPGSRITIPEARQEKAALKLLIKNENAQVKIEVTPVLRGCVYEPQLRSVSPRVEAGFGFAEVRVVSFADLYAGKIVAALDRQHPRDLFDIRDLLANEGIDDSLRLAFIVYLLSHNRPMAEILAPGRKPLETEFRLSFEGMTARPVSVEELTAAREELIALIVGKMPNEHKHLLISFKRGIPDWSLLALTNIADLPAVRWRQQNLDSLEKIKREELVRRLEVVLFR